MAQNDRPGWREMESDEMLGLPRDEWTIGIELADHIWNQTERSQAVHWGPDPPLLIEALMGHFDERSITDALNNWFFTRTPGKEYDTIDWVKVPSRLRTMGSEEQLGRLYGLNAAGVHPLRSKLHSQQYTVTGGMFTYDFQQWQTEEPTGFARVPMVSELFDEAIDTLTSGPFEHYETQRRMRASQFQSRQPNVDDYAHPHFRPDGTPTLEDYKQFFTDAFQIMKRTVRMETR